MVRKVLEGVVCFAVVFLAGGCHAVAAEAKLKIGDAAPDFSGVGTDDKPHSLAGYKDAKAIVVVFTCNHCPVAVAYQERLVALQKDYREKGVQVVAVCVSKGDADSLDAMKKRAADAGFNFPYLRDDSQKSGRDYGATCTPHAFVLDKDRKLAYTGSIDDNQSAEDVKKQHVRAALDALLEGKQPATSVTRQFGCGIHYE